MEKRMVQFALGSSYLVGNRNLHEFTLSLKDYSKVKLDSTEQLDEIADDDLNDEQFDNTMNLNVVTDLIRLTK